MRRDEFLRGRRVMRLATASADGTPHVAPVWYMYSGGRFYAGTSTATRKARNVRETGRAAVCIDEGVNSPLYGVMASCGASLVTGGRVRRLAERIIARYQDVRSESSRALLAETDCIIRLDPGRMVTWKY